MKNTIVNAYQWILYIGMAFWIFSSTIGGYSLGGAVSEDYAATGGVFGFFIGLISSVFFLGFVFVIIQIRDLLQDLVNIHKGTAQPKEKFSVSKLDEKLFGERIEIRCRHCGKTNIFDKALTKDFLRCEKCLNIIQQPSK